MKKACLALMLVLLGFIPLGAATVSVLVVEAGLPPGNGCTPSAGIWESGMMDTFFDAGHIVSNAPACQTGDLSSAIPSEAGHDFDLARTGGADFFVLVVLNYKGAAAVSAAPAVEQSAVNSPEESAELQAEQPKTLDCPKEVFIRVFRVSSGDLLHETRLSEKVWDSGDDEFLDAKRYAGSVVPQLSRKG